MIKHFALVSLLFFFFTGNVWGQAFITTWKTDNPGTTTDTQIEIPTIGVGYDYNILWTEVGNPANTGTLLSQTGSTIIDFPSIGIYRVEITGLFPRIYFNAGLSFLSDKDSHKILTIEQWGNNAWTSMASAFAGCENLTITAIDKPDLSGVMDMSGMFFDARALNTDISTWNVGTVLNMSRLFRDADSFNQPLDGWNVINVTNMSEMFSSADAFNQDLNSWIVDNVTTMQSMFSGATTFNGNISAWHVNSVLNMQSMFFGTDAFNQDIGSWEINATNLGGMFRGASVFNQDINFKPGGGNNGGDAWQTNGVLSMAGMFDEANAFTQDITLWDVSTVTNMSGMFSDNTTFNQNISGWNVDLVTDMSDMFSGATAFNQDISGWNVAMVRNFNGTLNGATSFDQPIGAWTLNTVFNLDMRNMFNGASAFDQDLSGWNVTNLSLAVNMFRNSGLSISNYDKLLEGWSVQTVKPNVNFGAQGIYYCSAQAAKDILTNAPNNWFITDEGSKCVSVFDGPNTSSIEITSGQPESIDFGSTPQGTPKTRNFTIENVQSIPITNVVVSVTGSEFNTSPTPSTIGVGATLTFPIDLTGATLGSYTETVSITSDDFTGTFQFTIEGEVTAGPEPEIKVFQGVSTLGDEILDGISAFNFGFEYRGTDILQEITITNLGSADLNISNISITGTAFSVLSATSLTIPVDGTEIVQVQLSGLVSGGFFETLTIENDDADEAVFDFNVGGSIEGPDILVVDGIDHTFPEILNGEITPIDFGSSPSGSDIVRQLAITDATYPDLVVSNISISGTAFNFTLPTPFVITGTVDGVWDERLFEITLSGTTPGTFTETVTITSDDDADPVFTFPITGTIIATGCVSPPTASVGILADGCEGSVIALAGSIGGSATASTWTTTGDGSFDDATILNATYTPGSGDISNGSVDFTLTTDDPDATGPCVVATDLTTVNIGRQAIVDAGTDQTICTSYIASLTGSITSGSNPLWSTSGTGTFSTPSTVNTDYTPSGADISTGTITLTLTADGTGVCLQTSDQLLLTIAQPIVAGSPSVQSNVNQPSSIDIISSSTINDGDVITVTIIQNPTKGTVVINGDNTIDYTPDNGTLGADSYQYQICNQCGLCSDGTVTIDILNEAPAINIPFTPITALAGQSVFIPFSTFLSDLNDNIDVNSIQVVAGPTSGATVTFDTNFDLTLDYSNTTFAGTDELTIRVCDLLNSCTTAALQIQVDGKITAFNGISPNGDGLNDFFLIQNIQYLEPDNIVKIFNRWGDKVFETEGYNPDVPEKRFEGKQNNGKELPSGVYFYKVVFSSGRKGLEGYLTLKK